MVAKSAGIDLFSEDPEIMALQAMIKGLRHITIKNLSPIHLNILSAVELFIKVGKQPPKIEQIALMGRMEIEDFKVELTQLVDHGYLHEVVPTYGDMILTYKPAAKGGTALRHILDRKAKATKTKKVGTS